MIYTTKLTSPTPQLMNFLTQCDSLGYKNNNSLKAMKFEWCLEEGGMWFATHDSEDEIISLSGIHPFKDGWRVLFRGAQLESRPCGLNRYHMQSYCFHSQLPYQIEWAKGHSKSENPFLYITTNTDTDQSGRMQKVNKTFLTLERYDIVCCLGKEEIFNVNQNVWLLDIKNYEGVRNGS
jgi:hypothetical protein